MAAAASIWRQIQTVVDGRALARALLALLLPLALALVSGKSEWLAVAIVPVALLIGLDRSQLAPLGVLAHAAAICGGFVILMATFAQPLLFVSAVVLLGMASVMVTAGGSNLRSLGNFTFIPALYLACESAEGIAPSALLARSVDIIPFLLIAALPVLLLAAFEHSRAAGLRQFAQWTRHHPDAEPNTYIEQMMTVACAVALTAVLVEWRHIGHGQWMIWSAVSVVTGNVVSARQKFCDRLTGAVVGVMLGIAIGLLLPHAPLLRVLIACTAMLTLVCVRHYALAFGIRCACAAMALLLAGEPWLQGGERLLNVAAGSTIGLLCALTAAVASKQKLT